jgi:hypothetical protein
MFCADLDLRGGGMSPHQKRIWCIPTRCCRWRPAASGILNYGRSL